MFQSTPVIADGRTGTHGLLRTPNAASISRYWSDLKRKLAQEAGTEQPYEKIVRLKLAVPDGKQRDTDCAEAGTLLRIVQSIPSPKAEPIKLWLARRGLIRKSASCTRCGQGAPHSRLT